jgi:predicted phosphodiesterase
METTMRIALLSDIHGNSLALDAVLADIAGRGGVDEYWLLGDLCALGHDPVGVLERLDRLPAARIIRGNTDRYVTTGDRPPPSADQVRGDGRLLETYAEVAATFAWTQGAVTAAGWFDWLAHLPPEMELTLPDGTACLAVHASPGRDDSPGFSPEQSDEEMVELLDGCPAQLVLAGHTHRPVNRRVGRWHVVNPGSVSNPRPPDLRACYAILTADERGCAVEHHRVEYDRDEVIVILQRQRHPGAAFLIRHLRGLIP